MTTDIHGSLSPSDLSAFIACPHLTQLERAVARGQATRPVFADPHAELIREKGQEHEAAYLQRLRAAGKHVVAITRSTGDSATGEPWQETERAIQAGEADVIYQAHFSEGNWRGVADFLERQSDGTYEPVETKLARTTKPDHVLQLCFYAEQLERIQGRLPERIHVEPGSGKRESFVTTEFMAYYRRVRGRFLAAIGDPPTTYPWPCDHCSICAWRRECHGRLVSDDNLVLVAGLGRSYVDRLVAGGISTLEQLGDTPVGTAVEDVRPATMATLRHQAELQLHFRRTGTHRTDLLPPEEGQGLSLLPEPSAGDAWIDFEGHPFYEAARGLEYLFGYCYRDEAGELRYEAIWANDHTEEKAAFERLVDWIVERRQRHPAMHVYHYADHERSTLRRLMGDHGTREDEIDDLLRGDVLVDLYRVTRQALRASVASYSIKAIEALYAFERKADVSGGSESTVAFEQWLECSEASLRDAIVLYNEEDCRSTEALHEWLVSKRAADLPWRAPPMQREVKPETKAAADESDRVRAELLARSVNAGDTWWLLAQLIDYHQREARPQYYEWYKHLELDAEELVEDSDTMGGLVLVGDPVPDKLSLVYTLSFPPQEHKISGRCVDPATKKSCDVEVNDDLGRIRFWRGKKRANEPLPRALIPSQPIHDGDQREAVLRFARSYLSGNGSYLALVGVVERTTPRASLRLAPPEAALTLDDSYLVVQGPPGAGKTWQGAKIAVSLMRAGHRIGVTSLSHKAINKLLTEIEREAVVQGFEFRGRKKFSDADDAFSGKFIDASEAAVDLLDPVLLLIAGTGWLFAKADFDRHVHTLIIDEAGQVAFADAIACGTAARNLIFLGDPNQLPQISQGAQPVAARASVLRHLLGENEVVPETLGIFLKETWRLRPEICRFTSEAYYKGRLEPATIASLRSLDAGNGLAVLPVKHEGRSQSSWEEADAVAAAIRRLFEAAFTDEKGRTRPLAPDDVLVVAPYNAQVRALRARVPDGVRVGTVDKFQGQEAPVVLVSFASSSGADAPRGIQFAFDRHRVNVATSRGQCRVVIVCEPRLLEAEARTVEHMRLMNAICRFAELASR